MANQIDEMVAQSLSEQLDQQREAEEEVRRGQQQTQQEIAGVRDALLRNLTQGREKKIEMPIEIQEIASALMAQPRFIEPTQKFLAQLTARVNNAVNEIINAVLDNPH
jgi:hypothetical protein